LTVEARLIYPMATPKAIGCNLIRVNFAFIILS
jgi:hypothetical protein